MMTLKNVWSVLGLLCALLALGITPALAQDYGENYEASRQVINFESDRFSSEEASPLSVIYDFAYETITVGITVDGHPDLPSYEDFPYPEHIFAVAIERDGQQIGTHSTRRHTEYSGVRTNGYTFDVVDGSYVVDLSYRAQGDDQQSFTQWYDRIRFDVDVSEHSEHDDYQITITQTVETENAPELSKEYFVAHAATYSAPPGVVITGDESGSVIAREWRGIGYAYVKKGHEIFFSQTRFSEPGWDLFDRTNTGWKITDISGENCDDRGVYEAGPGLTTTCNYTYDYEQPYPDVIAANTTDTHIVKTIIVNGGDTTAEYVASRSPYQSQLFSVYGGVLPTDDLAGKDAVRVIGRRVSGCSGAGAGCSYGGSTGRLEPRQIENYTVTISGTNCEAQSNGIYADYTTGDGVGLTECIFTYDYNDPGEVELPTITVKTEILGGPLRNEDISLRHYCGLSEPQIIEVDADGMIEVGACEVGGVFQNSGSFGQFLYGDPERDTYSNDYRVSETGENCDYGYYQVMRGYEGQEIQNATCEMTFSYRGDDNADPVPGDSCVPTATTPASGGVWGYDEETGEGCHLNPGSDSEDDNNEEENDDSNEDEEQEETTQCTDHDGDGWGWDGEKGCEVASENDDNSSEEETDSSIDPHPNDTCIATATSEASGGWGWDYGTQSGCQLDPGSDDSSEDEEQEEVGECIDHDGDGWGWDGEKGCQV